MVTSSAFFMLSFHRKFFDKLTGYCYHKCKAFFLKNIMIVNIQCRIVGGSVRISEIHAFVSPK